MNDEITVPFHLKTIRFTFGLITGWRVAVTTSFLLIFFGYIIDIYCQKVFYLTAMSSVVTFIGLILTIKNHYLQNLNSVKDMSVLYHGAVAEFGDHPDNLIKDPLYRSNVLRLATDEGLGLIIILSGTLLNAFGSLIPLMDLSNH